MCFDGDPCDVWDETFPRARKEHRCEECRLPIPVGDVHARVGTLFEGHWDTYRVHAGCLDLVRFIDKELCGSTGFYIGGLGEEIGQQDGEDGHTSHDEDAPCPAGDCLGMSTRETLEWLWGLIREPYRAGVPA